MMRTFCSSYFHRCELRKLHYISNYSITTTYFCRGVSIGSVQRTVNSNSKSYPKRIYLWIQFKAWEYEGNIKFKWKIFISGATHSPRFDNINDTLNPIAMKDIADTKKEFELQQYIILYLHLDLSWRKQPCPIQTSISMEFMKAGKFIPDMMTTIDLQIWRREKCSFIFFLGNTKP